MDTQTAKAIGAIFIAVVQALPKEIRQDACDRLRRAPFFYQHWHRCMQPSCRTSVVLREWSRPSILRWRAA